MSSPRNHAAPETAASADSPFRIVSGLSEIAADYDALICDVWGVLHDGAAPYPGVPECLLRWRAEGKSVMLLSNAPRPGASVARQLEAYGYMQGADGHYDALLTSGDATRAAIADGYYGNALLHLGPDRNLPLLEGLDLEITGVANCTFVLCSGLFDDEVESPGDYEGLLREMLSRDLPMLCANPDLTVMRGDKRTYCAGALAQAYLQMGGAVTFFGKPYPGVYATCMERLPQSVSIQGRSSPIARTRVLALGDGLLTDIAGGNRAKLDTALIAGGIHADEIGFSAREGVMKRGEPPVDPALLARACEAAGARPDMVLPKLVW